MNIESTKNVDFHQWKLTIFRVEKHTDEQRIKNDTIPWKWTTANLIKNLSGQQWTSEAHSISLMWMGFNSTVEHESLLLPVICLLIILSHAHWRTMHTEKHNVDTFYAYKNNRNKKTSQKTLNFHFSTEKKDEFIATGMFHNLEEDNITKNTRYLFLTQSETVAFLLFKQNVCET